MTTKASPPATTNAAASTEGVKIKKELPSDEIKEFAETAMNELLGWYGYDDVDRLDLSAKSSRQLKSAPNVNYMEKARSRSYNGLNGSRRSQHDGGDSTTSDHDTRSSREDSKSPNFGKAVDEKRDCNNCVWCRRPLADNSTDFLTTADGPRYCSESCFTQSRRASFKKAKTCDWCRHVRHAVNYVDFQDGASQLQFCSDKCLNQYKMQIFCKETQAHLDMNPHLRDKGLETAIGSDGLITPDLWLRNCRSRSASPTSTVSISPIPTAALAPQQAMSTTQPHKPLISVAPVAKLMCKSTGSINIRQSPKHNRKKRPSRVEIVSGGNNNNSLNSTKNLSNKSNMVTNSLNTSPKLPPKPFSTVHDLQHIAAAPISPIDGHPSGTQQPTAMPTNLPSSLFPGSTFPPRLPYMPQPHPRFFSGASHLMPLPDVVSGLLGPPPPVTVMVPYPIIIPLPIPIPIPLPIIDFIKAAQKKEDTNPTACQTNSLNVTKSTGFDEPLDFTKSKEEHLSTQLTASSDSPPPESNAENEEAETSKQKLPTIKLTRLHSKRLSAASTSSSYVTAPTSKEAVCTSSNECSRPLRKRKRIIDCDFQRMPTSKDIDVVDSTPSGNKQRK